MKLRSIGEQWKNSKKKQKESPGFVAPVTQGVPNNSGEGETKGKGNVHKGLGYQPQRGEQRKFGGYCKRVNETHQERVTFGIWTQERANTVIKGKEKKKKGPQASKAKVRVRLKANHQQTKKTNVQTRSKDPLNN